MARRTRRKGLRSRYCFIGELCLFVSPFWFVTGQLLTKVNTFCRFNKPYLLITNN